MFKIALRNITRNKKRSFFTILSTALGIMGLVFSISYLNGLAILIEKEAIKQTGHIRITDKNYYLKSRVFDTSSNVSNEKIQEKIQSEKDIIKIESIIKFAAYIFKDDMDEKVIGFGIEEKNHYREYLYEGKYFDINKKNQIILGKRVKEKLGLKLGDEITVVVNTQYNSTFALNYEIIGFVSEPFLDKSVLIPLSEAQYLLDMEKKSSELLITLNNKKNIEKEILYMKTNLNNENLLIESYEKIGFANTIEMYKKMKFVLVFLIGLLCSVAIFNTMVMTVFERRKEIGILKALGMEEKDIEILIILEGGILGAIGSFVGIIFGICLSLYYEFNGIYLGSALDNISENSNFGDRIYPILSFEGILLGLFTGIIISLLASYIPGKKEVKKEIVDNISIKKM